MSALTLDGQRISGLDYATALDAAERRSERSQAIREGIAAGRAESAREIELLRYQLSTVAILLNENISAQTESIRIIEQGEFNETQIRGLHERLESAKRYVAFLEQLPGIKPQVGGDCSGSCAGPDCGGGCGDGEKHHGSSAS